jgi:hypothetical protein
MRIGFLLFSILLVACNASKQANVTNEDAAYTRTITTRAEKIVQSLTINDSVKAKHITSIIANQYKNLNSVYTKRDDQIKNIKQKGLPKEETDKALKEVEASIDKKIAKLHATFLSKLSSELSADQVTKVKDGMTYNVLNVTYDAYVDMIPSLTKEQKDQIMTWLIEAREYAMDGESSEKKHWWFGKYKGRINNYLSAQGYDVTKERQKWEKRIKQKETQNQNQS